MGIFAPALILFDCLSGAHRGVDKTPFKIGSGPDCDWRIDDYSVAEEHCVIQRKGRAFYLLASNGTDAVLLDGVANAGGELAADVDHTLVIGGHFFALHGSSDAQKWLRGMSHAEWFIYDKAEQQKFGPLAFSVLANALEHRPDRGEHAIILCRGLTSMGFYAEQLLPWLNALFAVQLVSRRGGRAGSHLASLRRAPQQVRMGYLVRLEHFFQPFEIEKLDVVQLGRCARLAADLPAGRMHREMREAFA